MDWLDEGAAIRSRKRRSGVEGFGEVVSLALTYIS
jgi:hypothetical protein